MPRTVAFSLPSDTCQFNAHQLQPRMLATLFIRSWSYWMKDCWHLSFRELVDQHQTSVVVLGYGLEYLMPYTFHDGDGLRVETTVRARRDGRLVQQELVCRGPKGPVVRGVGTYHAVQVSDPHSLAAEPGALPAAIMSLMQADEVLETLAPSPLKARLPELERSGRVLGERTTPFMVHRHLCEVADQWSYAEVPTLASTSREALALEAGAKVPELRLGLSRPLRQLELELRRPFFAFDEGRAETRALASGEGGVAFVHQLMGADGKRATVAEWF